MFQNVVLQWILVECLCDSRVCVLTRPQLVLVSTQEEDSLLDKKDVFHLEGWGDYRAATIEPHVVRVVPLPTAVSLVVSAPRLSSLALSSPRTQNTDYTVHTKRTPLNVHTLH